MIPGPQTAVGGETAAPQEADGPNAVNEDLKGGIAVSGVEKAGLSRGRPHRDGGNSSPLAAWIDRPTLAGVGEGDHGDAAAGVHGPTLTGIGKWNDRNSIIGRPAGAGLREMTHSMDRARRKGGAGLLSVRCSILF